MRRYLLDSNAINALVDQREPLFGRLEAARLRGDHIGTCEPVVAELYYGLELSATRSRNLALLESCLRRIRVWPFDRAASREFGRIRAFLKRSGRQIQVIDIMQAAVAMTLGRCTVVTTDSDLSAIPGLSVIDWMKP